MMLLMLARAAVLVMVLSGHTLTAFVTDHSAVLVAVDLDGPIARVIERKVSACDKKTGATVCTIMIPADLPAGTYAVEVLAMDKHDRVVQRAVTTLTQP